MKLLRNHGIALGLTLAVALTATVGRADVPSSMNIQGRLADPAGTPLPAGLKIFTFKIFDQETAGTEIWPAGPGEQQTLFTDDNGNWGAAVGEIIPLTEEVFLERHRWLQITVDDGVNPAETLPRLRVRAHGYSLHSQASVRAETAERLGTLTEADVAVASHDHDGTYTPTGHGHSWNSLTSVPPGFADGVDNDAGGDITAVNTGLGLTGGASSGSVTLSLAPNGVMSSHVVPNSLTAEDLAPGSVGALELQDGSVASIDVQNGSLFDVDIGDEPGIAQNLASAVTLFGGVQTVLSRSIDCPEPGYVLAMASFSLSYNHESNTLGACQISLSKDQTTMSPFQTKHWSVTGGGSSLGYTNIASVQHIFSVSGGPVTIFLLGEKIVGTRNFELGNIALSLVYIPTRYGSFIE